MNDYPNDIHKWIWNAAFESFSEKFLLKFVFFMGIVNEYIFSFFILNDLVCNHEHENRTSDCVIRNNGTNEQ